MAPTELVLATGSMLAAFVAVVLAWKLRVLEARVASLEEGLRRQTGLVEEIRGELKATSRRLTVLEKAVAKALESYEAEEMLERLRRKRRRRYIVFYVVTEDGSTPKPEDVEKAVLRALERLAGQLAVASSRVQLVYYVPEKAAGIIRASHETKYLVLAALGLVRKIGDKKAIIVPVRTTGTIKTAKRVLGLTLRELKK